jgi:glycosyltransferase involved in cell wall biosynthesis
VTTRDRRILHVITESAPFGGAQRNTLLTVTGLVRDGYATALACGGSGRLIDEARAVRVPVHAIADLVRRPDPRRDARALRQLYRLIRAGGYDVVHTHSTKAGVLGRLAARAARTPLIVHTHHGVPFPLTRSLQSRAWAATERLLARFTDHVVCVGDVLRAEMAALGVVPEAKLVTIHSGIEFSEYRPRRSVEATRRALRVETAWPVIGSIGRLCQQKAQPLLVDAVARLRGRYPDMRLLLAGDGPLRATLERQIAAHGLAGVVHLLGERDDIADVLGVLHIYAMSSRWEGVGRAMTEAMYWGLPVVATAVNGVTELAMDGRTALVVPPGDAPALARAIDRLAADRALAGRLGAEARRTVLGLMGADRMVASIEALYDARIPVGRAEMAPDAAA